MTIFLKHFVYLYFWFTLIPSQVFSKLTFRLNCKNLIATPSKKKFMPTVLHNAK